MLPSIEEMIADLNSPLKDVLAVIDKNAQGIVFLVDANHKLQGVLTDGDIRRALIKGVDLGAKAREIARSKFQSKSIDTSPEELAELLGVDGVRHIPLVDATGKLVDYACTHRVHRIPVMEPHMLGNELSYVMDCVQSRWISSQGKYVGQFEKMFSDICGGGHAVAVSNGTVALHLAMVALDIGPGDEVIVPDLTFAASINTIILAGATPVLVDIDPKTWCIDPKAMEAAITSKTKAVMPVHLYGFPCEMNEIMRIAKKHKLLVIEDAAEALGTLYHGKSVGLFGEAGSFSFFGNKMITTGEGGMIIFKDAKTADRARMLRDHGMSKEKRYWHLEVGFNYRMTNLQAAIGVAQLEQFESILEKKLSLARSYEKALSGCTGITLPATPENGRNTHWLYTILVDEKTFESRDILMQKLLANGIESRPVFYPLHQMPPYQKYIRTSDSFKNSIHVSKVGMSLPSSATLTAPEIDRICKTLHQIISVKEMTNTI